MAEVTQQQVVDYIKGITVLELSQLVKTLEAELGVSAAAAMPIGSAVVHNRPLVRRRPGDCGAPAAVLSDPGHGGLGRDRHPLVSGLHNEALHHVAAPVRLSELCPLRDLDPAQCHG